jgi:hypothetical protein
MAVLLEQPMSFEDWLGNPPEDTEWVEGSLIYKAGMTGQHSRTQSRLDYYWRHHLLTHRPGAATYLYKPVTKGSGLPQGIGSGLKSSCRVLK